jgi:hypothetical protein
MRGVPPTEKFPDTFPDPITSSFCAGADVPMPALPFTYSVSSAVNVAAWAEKENVSNANAQTVAKATARILRFVLSSFIAFIPHFLLDSV